MINTTTTIETTFQVIDPIDEVPPGSTLLQYVESGAIQLPTTTNALTVTFGTVKAAATYLFDELYVKNTVDAQPIIFDQPEVTSVSTTAFTVLLNGVADTTNYYLIFKVRIPT